jgi:mannose-6-phosphate isomerase-like protein (cupin superfamily)
VKKIQPKTVKANILNEYLTPERCYIAENCSYPAVSIARARVKPGVTTVAHHLKQVDEYYIITRGKGRVTFAGLAPTEVAVGDVIVIPAGASQKITNIGKTDLVFYCVCTPRFTEACYFSDEAQKSP